MGRSLSYYYLGRLDLNIANFTNLCLSFYLGIKDVAIQVHKDHQEGSLKSSIADSISDGANSYVSRISQQVFVDPKHAKNYDIKNKFASFFSSVSASKTKYKTNNTKL